MSTATANDPNRAVLLAALHPDPDHFTRLSAQHGGALDWDWLFERATAHKIAALLASRVATRTQARVPDEIRQRLNEEGAKALERSSKGLHDLEVVDRCLARAGISYLLLKGPVLTQFYDSPAQRHFFDLDLMVRETDVDAAQAALEGLGYRLWGGDRYLGFAPAGADELARATRAMRAALKRFGHELAFVTDDRSLLPIDLHWQLMPPRRMRVPAAQLWDSVTTAVLGGVSVQVLDPEATLLHLAMHAWSNRPWGFTLLHLCDVAWALRRLPIDPNRLARLADRWGCADDLSRALYAVEHALAVTPPPQLQVDGDALRPSRRFRRIVTPENLLEHYARPLPVGWARFKQDVDWGLTMGTLSSTAAWFLGQYAALIRYHARFGR
jgi:hypothetical protein